MPEGYPWDKDKEEQWWKTNMPTAGGPPMTQEDLNKAEAEGRLKQVESQCKGRLRQEVDERHREKREASGYDHHMQDPEMKAQAAVQRHNTTKPKLLSALKRLSRMTPQEFARLNGKWRTMTEKLAWTTMNKALHEKGWQAASEVWQRIEGKVTDKVEHSMDLGKSITLHDTVPTDQLPERN